MAADLARVSGLMDGTINELGLTKSGLEKYASVMPVSYTHLDVYKRQAIYKAVKTISMLSRNSNLRSKLQGDFGQISFFGENMGLY